MGKLALAPMLIGAFVTVIDGDTVEEAGQRWRLVGIDAPEIHHAKCFAEREAGIIAAARLIGLIRDRGARLEAVDSARRDKYGRKLGRLFVGEEDWATIAVREKLAVARDGRGKRPDWCGRPSSSASP